jgi:hypothetical protein
MSEAVFAELFASCDSAVKMAARNVGMARALAEAHRSGLRPPESILEAYLAAVERDEAQLVTLRQQVQRFRPDARLQT